MSSGIQQELIDILTACQQGLQQCTICPAYECCDNQNPNILKVKSQGDIWPTHPARWVATLRENQRIILDILEVIVMGDHKCDYVLDRIHKAKNLLY